MSLQNLEILFNFDFLHVIFCLLENPQSETTKEKKAISRVKGREVKRVNNTAGVLP